VARGFSTFITWTGARAGPEGGGADLDREEPAMAAAWRPFGSLGGGDPFRELRRLQDEMDRLAGTMGPAAGGRGGLAAAAPGGFPAVNVYAGQDGIAVVAELPGVGKDDLEVQVHQDTLSLSGGRRPAAEREEAYHRRERRSGRFTRSIQLPYRVDPERIEARLENGVLHLSLPRPQEDKPRRIAISG
jgi:HSP20 family protein